MPTPFQKLAETTQRRPLRRAAIVAAVVAAHTVLFALLGLGAGASRTLPLPSIIDIELTPPPQPPPRRPEPAVEAGGGAPAAPSRVHVPPEPPPDRPVEVAAPVEQAPEPELVVGAAPTADPVPGAGLGGEGTGVGGGTGSGAGPGSGSAGPRLLRGPSQAEIARQYPPDAMRARRPGRGLIACRIRLDTRLTDCRVVSETPPGQGFGQAALAASAGFRFRPPTENGRPVDGREVTVGVDFFPR